METTTPVSDKQKDLNVLEYTNTIRKQLVSDIIASGMPSALDNREVLLKTLDGIDKNTLSKMKLRIEEASAQTAKASQQLVASYLREKSRRNLEAHRSGNIQTEPEVHYEIDDAVPGEMDINPIPVELIDILDDDNI